MNDDARERDIREIRKMLRIAYDNGYAAGRAAEKQNQLDRNADLFIAALERGKMSVSMPVSETGKASYSVKPIGYSEEFRGQEFHGPEANRKVSIYEKEDADIS